MFNWFKKKNKNKDENKDELLEEFQEEISDEDMESYFQEDINEVEEIEENKIKSDLLKEKFNIKGTVQDFKEEIKEEIEEFKEEIEEFKEEIKEEYKEIKEEIKEEIEEFKEEVEIEKPKKKMNLFEKLVGGLTKTRNDISNKIDGILKSYKKIDEELFEDLEEALVTADVGVNTTMELIERLRNRVKEEKISEPEMVKSLLKDEIRKLMLESVTNNELIVDPSPAIILVVGVNGVGKTTTIGKLSNNYKNQGKKVLIAAGDTFRAAAIEQLEEWGNRANVDVISHTEGADPAAVIFDGIQAAKARKSDLLICDTAGRLHNKSNLMNELNKISRVIEREYGDATKEVLLVLDATTGQNAINQAKVFKEVVNISGVALTKLDGTAKGGVIIALQAELNVPVKLVGVGEGIEDLQPFVVEDFVEALFN